MKQNLTLRIVVSASALFIAAAHILRPDARIDSITIVLLVICALPWLQPLIKTIELLGVKLELQELQDKVAESQGSRRECVSPGRSRVVCLHCTTDVAAPNRVWHC